MDFILILKNSEPKRLFQSLKYLKLRKLDSVFYHTILHSYLQNLSSEHLVKDFITTWRTQLMKSQRNGTMQKIILISWKVFFFFLRFLSPFPCFQPRSAYKTYTARKERKQKSDRHIVNFLREIKQNFFLKQVRKTLTFPRSLVRSSEGKFPFPTKSCLLITSNDSVRSGSPNISRNCTETKS